MFVAEICHLVVNHLVVHIIHQSEWKDPLDDGKQGHQQRPPQYYESN